MKEDTSDPPSMRSPQHHPEKVAISAMNQRQFRLQEQFRPWDSTSPITRLRIERNDYFGRWARANRRGILDHSRRVNDCHRILPNPAGRMHVSRTFSEHWEIFRVCTASSITVKSGSVCRGLWARENRQGVCTSRNPIWIMLRCLSSRGTRARIFNCASQEYNAFYRTDMSWDVKGNV